MTIIYSRKYRKSSLLNTKRVLLSAAMCIMMLFSISQYASAQAGVWTWMSGSDSPNSTGNYGIKGVSSPENEPPPRYQAAHWKDKDGNFWIFGGLDFQNLAHLSDLWKFDPLIAEWTWVNGPNTPNNPAVFGNKGVPSPLNLPPGLGHGTLCWYDGDDGLYLYGGLILTDGFRTNVWKYSITMDEWVWLTGSEFIEDLEVSGMKGIPSSENTPGIRFEAETCWTHKKKLWFSCGQNQSGGSSATWQFDPNIMQWTWMHGPLLFDPVGVKGIEGIFDEANYPSSRNTWSKWSHEANAYIFSGSEINDLWHYNSDSLAWRFLGEGNALPFWEDYCVSDDETQPSVSGEMQTAEVIQECKEVLWLYGGGVDHAMWAYDLNQNNWVLAWGTPGYPEFAVHGMKGVPSADNIVGNRQGGSMWSDNDGNLWVYGGSGYGGMFSDMWRFEPDYSCLNLSDTSACCELTVSFRISNTMDSSGSVEIQVVDGEGLIEYSIDGGVTWSTENFFDDLLPGDYDIVVRDENGCLFTGTITILDISVGTTNLENVDFSFSPNPVTDIMTIQLSQLDQSSDSKARIRVIDMSGRVLIKSFTDIENSTLQTKLSLRDLSQGSYFIQILIDDYYILQKISKI